MKEQRTLALQLPSGRDGRTPFNFKSSAISAGSLPVFTNNPLLSDYLTVDEFAQLIGKDKRTVQRWLSLGIGPPITRIGKTPLFQIDSAKAWIKNQEAKPLTRISRRK